jgi:hypothetical protein
MFVSKSTQRMARLHAVACSASPGSLWGPTGLEQVFPFLWFKWRKQTGFLQGKEEMRKWRGWQVPVTYHPLTKGPRRARIGCYREHLLGNKKTISS